MSIIKRIVKVQPNFVKKAYYDVIPFKYRYGKVFRETYSFLKKVDYWSYDRTREYQFEELKKLLKHAKINVPYYGKLFAEYDFNTNITSISELKKLPLLNKSIINKNFEDLIAKNYNGNKVKFKTSGSTGDRFEFYGDDSMYKKEAAYILHSYNSHGGNLYDKWSIWIRRHSPKDNNDFVVMDYELKRIYLSAFHLNDQTIKMFVKIINNTKCETISTYPSTAYWLSCLLEKHNLKLPYVKTIHGASEKCLDEWSDKIIQVFGFPIKMHYGLVEKVSFMYQSSISDFYHEDLTYSYTEYDNDNTIIGTSFMNYIMPFIRYRTNDIATLNENVDYNSSKPLIVKKIDGRVDDMIVTKDGSKLPSVNFYTIMSKVPEVSMFQLYQKLDKSIELRIVINENYNELVYRHLNIEMNKRVGDLPLVIKEVDEIKRNKKTGKIRCVITEIK